MLGFERELELDGEVQTISDRENAMCKDRKLQMTLKELSANEWDLVSEEDSGGRSNGEVHMSHKSFWTRSIGIVPN